MRSLNLRSIKYLPFYLLGKLLRYDAHAQVSRLFWAMPILGIFYFIKNRYIPKIIYPFLLSFLPAFCLSMYKIDLWSAKNAIANATMILFSLFLARYYSKEECIKLVKGGIFLSAIYAVIQLFLGYYQIKDLYGGIILWPQFHGLQGFSNHTGLTMSVFTLILIVHGEKRWAILSSLLLLLSASRTAWCVFLVGIFLVKFDYKLQKYSLKISNLIIGLLLTFPLWIFLIERVLSDNYKLLLNKALSFRYVLYLVYAEASLDHLLGVGVGNSVKYLPEYAQKGSSITKTGQFIISSDLKLQASHNTFIDILFENGFLGYVLMCIFIYLMNRLAFKKNSSVKWIFIASLFGLSTLNGLFEFSLYLIFAIILIDSNILENADKVGSM